MKFNELSLTKNRSAKRVGRGISAGRGKTAGRGTKGQGSRKSGGVRPGFEGGQMPLYMRIPKLRGFRSHRPTTFTIYTGQLNDLKSTTVDNFLLAEKGLVPHPYCRVKLINRGELTKKMTVKLQGASQSSIAALQKVGGAFEVTQQQKRPSKNK